MISMNVLRELILVGLLLATFLQLSTGEATVELEISPEVAQEGRESVIIECAVKGWNETTDSVGLSRQLHDQTIEPLFTSRGYLDGRVSYIWDDNSYNFTYTIFSASRNDALNYTCSLGTTIDEYNLINDTFASATKMANVNYRPYLRYPICDIENALIGDSWYELMKRTEGDNVTLVCTSEMGMPPVELQWTRELPISSTSQYDSNGGDVGGLSSSQNDTNYSFFGVLGSSQYDIYGGLVVEPISSQYDRNGDIITATAFINLTLEDDEAYFRCRFTNISRSCLIGPFQIMEKTEYMENMENGTTACTSVSICLVVAFAIVAAIFFL